MIVKFNPYDLDFWSCLFVGLVSVQMTMYVWSFTGSFFVNYSL
jgi:hypothetical protein